MAGEHQYFYEDEVYRITKKGNVQFGMVLENSELVSSDENSDEEEGGRMKKGHIRVAWHPTGVEEVIPESKVELADRSLMPGDVVRRMIKGKDTQRGYCRAIRVEACVQVVGSKQVITKVKSTDLVPLEIYAVDIAACLDCWVGGIKTVHSKITLQCSDGSRCIINDVDACAFENFCEKRDMDYNNREDFYPGQALWGPVHFLENAEWIHCTKEMKANFSKHHKTVKVIVEDIQTDSVGVHWQCRAYSKDGVGLDKEQPKFIVQGEDLKRLRLLNVFDPCTQQVGDRNFYTFNDGDIVITKEQWRRNQRESVVKNCVVNGQIINAKRSPKRNIHPKVLGGIDSASLVPGAPLGEGAASVNIDDQDDWDTEDTVSISDTSVSSGASSVTSQGKKKRGPALMTKVLKKKKLRRTRRRTPQVTLVPGARVVVETLSTKSIADVVWQDGSVEENIPSTQLYPIHHLDDQEFFPGDFVIENKDGCYQTIYGVVQCVDHAGRTATVKWFKTYMSEEEPQPTVLDETEVSVYDLKDHPDFQYRPGTVVIRVANFSGEHETCTAGQVLDNFPEGMVRVWWVDGHASMSWPQDLYKVGEYDSDEGELWDDGSSDASWETESEDCFIAEDEINPEESFDEKLKPKLGANIEKARIAMARLEEIFMQNPGLQTTAVMRQLLEVYKDCRYLDKLMGTSFFHESHFQGLLERVRERGRANVAQRVADHVSRLFHQPESGQPDSPLATSPSVTDVSVVKSDSKLECKNLVSNGVIGKNLKTVTSEIATDTPKCRYKTLPLDTESDLASNSVSLNELVLNRNVSLLERKMQTAANNNKNIGNDIEHIEYAKEEKLPVPKSKIEVVVKTSKSQTDTKVKHSSKHSMEVPPVVDGSQSSSNSNQQVCAKLCALIKAQLVKAHNEVTRRFGGNQTMMTLSVAANTRSSGSSSKSDGEDAVEAEATGGERISNIVKSCVDSVLNRLSGVPCDEKESLKETDKEKVETAKKEEDVVCAENEEETDEEKEEGFSIMDCAPNSHKFKLTMFQPTDPAGFFKTVRKELKLLRTSLPPGIWVKGFEDRMDLYSVMIRGPEKTPYEDGLFFFDFQLSADYPKAPPLCHYISYCSDRLNPNLYEDGKVCISLLGTWSGKGTEVWSQHSNLLQVIISIQGLILVSEPYFNEAGYEKQKGSQQGNENSRMYNEMAVLKLVQAMAKMIVHPPPVFREEIFSHFRSNAHKLLNRLDTWLDISERYNTTHPVSPTTPTSFREVHGPAICAAENVQLPEFPLIPASKGFCLTLRKTIVTFREVLATVDIHEQPPPS